MRTSPSGLRKGAWTEQEDILLRKCIEKYGEGRWYQVPHRSGLNRCRKSCRLRWLNYLRPNINRGDFSSDEDDLIIRLHKLLGNRWSLIAGRLPNRTANDIKNYWNSHLQKKLSPNIDGGNSSKNNINNNKSPKITATTIIKPRPRTFSKCAPPWLMNLKNPEITTDQTISTRIVNDEAIMNPVITDLGPKSDESNMVGSIGNDMQWLDNLLLNDDAEMVSEGPIWSFYGGGSTGDELGGMKHYEGIDVDVWDLLFSDL